MIYLVRHGETDWNRLPNRFLGQRDLPLNKNGIVQAKALSLFFQDKPVQKIYTSPLIRAIQTAQEIAALNEKIQILIEPALAEQKLGAWEGKSYLHIAFSSPFQLVRWMRSSQRVSLPEGSESLRRFIERVLACYERIHQKATEEDVIIISHFGVIKVILSHLMTSNLNHSHSFRIRNGQIIAIPSSNQGIQFISI